MYLASRFTDWVRATQSMGGVRPDLNFPPEILRVKLGFAEEDSESYHHYQHYNMALTWIIE